MDHSKVWSHEYPHCGFCAQGYSKHCYTCGLVQCALEDQCDCDPTTFGHTFKPRTLWLNVALLAHTIRNAYIPEEMKRKLKAAGFYP